MKQIHLLVEAQELPKRKKNIKCVTVNVNSITFKFITEFFNKFIRRFSKY